MSWRLRNLSICNFKVFPSILNLKLEGKNLLLYGQNGSGKSSIFWAMYTLYLSRYKENQGQVKKYFDRNSDENLLNRHTITDDAFIKAEYLNTDNDNTQVLQLSNNDLSIVDTKDSFLEATTTFSDFLNYHKQTSLFDYCNSEENDVFDTFVRDYFPFIKLQRKCVKLDGSSTRTELASEWWDYILFAVNHELRNPDGSFLDSADKKYELINTILTAFNAYLKQALQGIKLRTDSILHDVNKLNIPFVEILFDYEDVTFNHQLMNLDRTDHMLHQGKIIISFIDNRIQDIDRQTIKRPRTFFNEATLSKIALAIRLAVFEIKANFTADDGSRLLFIDDLMISFDMVNRIEIANFILSYENDYQLIIFTHDRSFYNLLHADIQNNKAQDNWLFKDIYMDFTTIKGRRIPTPRLSDSLSYIEKAEEFYSLGENIACTVFLRKEAERIAKYLMEQRYLDNENVITGKCSSKNLSELLAQLPSALNEYGIAYSSNDIQILRTNVLNVSAHDSVDMPLYRTEISRAISEIKQLGEYKRTQICNHQEIGSLKFNLHLVNGAEIISVTFVFLQTASKLQDKYGIYYYPDVDIRITKVRCHGVLAWSFIKVGQDKKLVSLFKKVCNKLNKNFDLGNSIIKTDNGKKLKDL